MAAQSDVEELIAERAKLGGNRYRMSKRAKGDFTYLLSLFDRLVPYTAPAAVPSAVVEELERKLAEVRAMPVNGLAERMARHAMYAMLAIDAIAALRKTTEGRK